MTKADLTTSPHSVGRLELSLLSIVEELSSEAFGAKIWSRIEALEQRSIASGAIYTCLHRLEDKGLIVASESPPTPIRGGRRKVVYRLTNHGKRVISAFYNRYPTNAEHMDLSLA